VPKLVVLGATSAIAEQVLRLFAGPELHALLVARNDDALSVIAEDIKIRGAGKVDTISFDFSRLNEIEKLTEDIIKIIGEIDILFVAYGTLPNQKECEDSISKMQAETNLNYLSVVSVLTGISPVMKQNETGTIAVISSVAGDRGRKSNYVYGSAKGGLTIFLQGLRNALSGSGVHVLTIKPGFVDTPMTNDFTKGLLWAKPEKVAKDIKRAIDKKKNIIYTPWFWRWIMLIIRLIPESVFKKMNL
jgi:decaprenylphospho-beta-D-erythro-pentofuranosid-2-ulose 2-reductase